MATSGPELTQATLPLPSKRKRARGLIPFVVVVDLLILGELTFQWAKGRAWTTYTTDDGLARNTVESIVVAPGGAVWFGTSDGASRFDGETWTTYTRANSGLDLLRVGALAVDGQGRVWVGGFGNRAGLGVFDDRVACLCRSY